MIAFKVGDLVEFVGPFLQRTGTVVESPATIAGDVCEGWVRVRCGKGIDAVDSYAPNKNWRLVESVSA